MLRRHLMPIDLSAAVERHVRLSLSPGIQESVNAASYLSVALSFAAEKDAADKL
jgi:hypothetical protein